MQHPQQLLLLLGPVGGPLAGDGLETGLDGLDRAARVALHALEEEDPGLLVQHGVGRAAGVAGDVLLDVTPQHVLDVFLLEFALDDQLVVAVHGARRSQLGAEELEQVAGLTMKPAVMKVKK